MVFGVGVCLLLSLFGGPVWFSVLNRCFPFFWGWRIFYLICVWAWSSFSFSLFSTFGRSCCSRVLAFGGPSFLLLVSFLYCLICLSFFLFISFLSWFTLLSLIHAYLPLSYLLSVFVIELHSGVPPFVGRCSPSLRCFYTVLPPSCSLYIFFLLYLLMFFFGTTLYT